MHILELLHPNHTSVPTAIMLAISCADLAIARLELLTYGTVWWSGLTLPLMPHSVRCVPSPSIVLCHCIHTLRNVNWLWPCSCFGAVIIGCRDYIKNKRKKKKKKNSKLTPIPFFQTFHIPYHDSSVNKKNHVPWIGRSRLQASPVTRRPVANRGNRGPQLLTRHAKKN